MFGVFPWAQRSVWLQSKRDSCRGGSAFALGFETMPHGLTAYLLFSGANGALSGKYQLPQRLRRFDLNGFLFLEVNYSARLSRDRFGNFNSQEFSRITLEPFAKFCKCLEIGHVSILHA